MANLFDVGMSADEVKAEAEHMQSKGDRARKYVTDLLTELYTVKGSWWGTRSADAQAQVKAAEASINEFHQEIQRMVEILRANVAEFQKFDQSR